MIYTDKIIEQKQNNRKKLGMILKIITYPFIALIILLVFYAGYLKYIKHEDDINILGFRQYVVATGSMEPQYNIGDLIITKEKAKEEIKTGDIINYISNDKTNTVTHRIVDIVKKDGQIFYRTKGDNNNSEDSELVNYNQVKGVLVFKISKVGTIMTKLITETGITIIFAIIILSYLRDKNKEEKIIARENARKIYNVPKYKENDI